MCKYFTIFSYIFYTKQKIFMVFGRVLVTSIKTLDASCYAVLCRRGLLFATRACPTEIGTILS